MPGESRPRALGARARRPRDQGRPARDARDRAVPLERRRGGPAQESRAGAAAGVAPARSALPRPHRRGAGRMNHAEPERELADGGPRRAYLLAGAETLLRDDALAALRRAVIADADPAFLIDQLDGAAAPGELLDALHTLPVIAPRRMVVLAEPEARRGSARALLEALADWVGSEAADTSVLVAVAEHPDRRARWVKAFGDAVVSCDAPRAAREIAAFTRAEAARQRVELERGVAEALAERIGPQLQLL